MKSALGRYFFGQTDARPVALFRIVFGLVVALDGIDRIHELGSLYSDDGLLPRSVLQVAFVPRLFASLANFISTPTAAGVLIALGITFALGFALGFHGRLCAAFVWVYLGTLVARNTFAADGSDCVMMVMAWWSMFIDVDAAWSIRRRRTGLIAAWPVRAAQCQVALIYLVAGFAKSGPQWHHGRALFAVLQLNGFARPLGMTFLQWPSLCALLTWATLATELSFLPLAIMPWPWPWRRWARWLAIGAAAALHLGILLLMRVGMFPYVMLACLCLLLPIESRSVPPGPPRWRLRDGLVALLLLLVLASVVLGRRTPDWLRGAVRLAQLSQSWQMFAPDPPEADVYWAATGQRADGSSVDVLRQVAPEMLPQAPLRFSRWYKIKDDMEDMPQLQALLLRYLCRRLSAPPRMVDAHLQLWRRSLRKPWEAPHVYTLAFDRAWHCTTTFD